MNQIYDINTNTAILNQDYKIISVNDYNNLINEIKKFEKEKNNIEIKKNILDKECHELKLSIQEHLDNIRILNEEKAILQSMINVLQEKVNFLECENKELHKRLDNLEDKNNALEKNMLELSKEKMQKDNLIKFSQCIYNYKKSIMKFIFKENYEVDKDLQTLELHDVLLDKENQFDLTDEELERKTEIYIKINNSYKTSRMKNGVKNFFRATRILNADFY
jgi:chromosome segregation ATPase